MNIYVKIFYKQKINNLNNLKNNFLTKKFFFNLIL